MSNVISRQKAEVTFEAGDIEIGAVEIKDHDSNTRLDVELDSSKNSAFVQSESLAQELTLLGIKSKTDLLTFISDRLKVDAQISGGNGTDLWQIETFNGKGFAVSTPVLAISSVNEFDFFLLKNPSGSGKLMRLKEIVMSLHETSGSFSSIKIWRDPTITSDGTALMIFKVKSDQTATSVAQAFQAPTISSRGTLVNTIQLTGGGSFIRELDLSRYLVDGKNLLISIDPSGINQQHTITMAWLEV